MKKLILFAFAFQAASSTAFASDFQQNLSQSFALLQQVPSGKKLVADAVEKTPDLLSVITECETIGETEMAVTTPPQVYSILYRKRGLPDTWTEKEDQRLQSAPVVWERSTPTTKIYYLASSPKICFKKDLEIHAFTVALAHELVHFTYKNYEKEFLFNTATLTDSLDFVRFRMRMPGGEVEAFRTQLKILFELRKLDLGFQEYRDLGLQHLDDNGNILDEQDFYTYLILHLEYGNSETQMFDQFLYRQLYFNYLFSQVLNQSLEQYQRTENLSLCQKTLEEMESLHWELANAEKLSPAVVRQIQSEFTLPHPSDI